MHLVLAQYDILYRLAEIKTDTSAKVLVDILLDENVHYQAHSAETLGDAIVRCGKPCLPYLQKIGKGHRQKYAADEMIKAINEGRETFF